MTTMANGATEQVFRTDEDAGRALEGLLSDRMFGIDAPGETPPPDEEALPEPPADEVEEDDEPEEQTEEPGESEDQAPADEEPPIETLEAWAEAAEVSLDDLLKLKHRVKADGEERDVTIADLIDGYQKGTNYERKATELGERRRALVAHQQQGDQLVQQAHADLSQRLALAAQIVMEDVNALEAAVARGDDDPAELYARKLQLDQRLGQLRAHQQQVQAQQAQHHQQAFQRRLALEQELLTDRIPGWGTEHQGKVRSVMEEFGFTPEEIGGVTDHRAVLLAYALAEAKAKVGPAEDRAVKAKALAEKAKREVPKMAVQPKKPGTPGQRAAAANARLHKRLQQTGKTEDAAALLLSKHSKIL